MSEVDLTISGNKAILDNLDRVSRHLQEGIQAKLEEAGQMALERAQELVPVDTGYLQSQLYVDVQPGVVTVGDDAPYAVFVELGTHKMAAQPYLVPAWLDAGQWLKDSFPGLLG